MSKRAGYAIVGSGDGLVAVKVVRHDGTHFKVEWVERVSPGRGFPAGVRRELSRHPDSLTLVLPEETAHLLEASLPPLKPKEAQQALLGLVLRDKGGVPGDWILSCTALAEEPVGGAAAPRRFWTTLYAPREVVSGELSRMAGQAVTPQRVVPGFLALGEFYRGLLREKDEKAAWSLVFLAGGARFVCVGDACGVHFVRSLPEDLSGGSEPREYIQRLTAEVERSHLIARQSDRSLDIRRIVVAGDPTLADPVAEELAGRSDIAAERWRLEESFESEGGAPAAELFLPLVAAATCLEPLPLNLLPASARVSRGRKLLRKGLRPVAAAAALAAPLLLLGGLWVSRAQDRVLGEFAPRMEYYRERCDQGAVSYLQGRVAETRHERTVQYERRDPELGALLKDMASLTPGTVRYLTLKMKKQPLGGYDLILEGESVGPSSEEAQRGFNRFLGALNDYPRLLAASDPKKLQITGDGDRGQNFSRVLFTLDYSVNPEVAR